MLTPPKLSVTSRRDWQTQSETHAKGPSVKPGSRHRISWQQTPAPVSSVIRSGHCCWPSPPLRPPRRTSHTNPAPSRCCATHLVKSAGCRSATQTRKHPPRCAGQRRRPLALTTSGQTAQLWDLSASPLAGGKGASGPEPPADRQAPALTAELPVAKGMASVSFSPDGRWLLLEGIGQPSRLYRTDVPRVRASELKLLRPEGKPGSASLFSPDGRWLAADADGKNALLWYLGVDKPNPKPLSLPVKLRDDEGALPKFSPDSRWLAARGGSAGILLWDLKNPASVSGPSPPLRGEGRTGWVEFSPDSLWLSATPLKPHRPGEWDDARPCLWSLKGASPTFNRLPLDTGFWAGQLLFGKGGRYVVALGMLDYFLGLGSDRGRPDSHAQRIEGRVEVSPDRRWLVAWRTRRAPSTPGRGRARPNSGT